MYKGVPFCMQKMEVIEEDLKELAMTYPHARTIQLLSANPFALSFEKLEAIFLMIRKYLPDIEYIYGCTRVTDFQNKTVEQLRRLKELGMKEVSLGIESGDDDTLQRINKGYHTEDIIAQCRKLKEAGIDYWMTFLNGTAGKALSHDHAVHSAEIFSQCEPMTVGTGGLVLFPGTPLLEEAERGEFDPLNEKEMMEELYTFLSHLTCDCRLITHHTISGRNLGTNHFLEDKETILTILDEEIHSGNLDLYARIRSSKRTL